MICFNHPLLPFEYDLINVSDFITIEMLELAYRFGIFPLYNAGEPVQWWYPSVRWILDPKNVYVSKSMRKLIRTSSWKLTCDKDFEGVINACATAKNRKNHGTWIDSQIISCYSKWHNKGRAHSFEVWNDECELVGGFYGVQTGQIFSGESMFSNVSNASKLAFINACYFFQSVGVEFIDCQMHSNHLESLGALSLTGKKYLELIKGKGFHRSDQNINWQKKYGSFC